MLLIGPPGVGKTMLAVALGRAAVEAGYRVYYTYLGMVAPATGGGREVDVGVLPIPISARG